MTKKTETKKTEKNSLKDVKRVKFTGVDFETPVTPKKKSKKK